MTEIRACASEPQGDKDDNENENENEFNNRFGPFYTIESVAFLQDRSEADVLTDIETRSLLAIITTDGVPILTTRQFDESGMSLPGLREVWDRLGAEEPLAVALFLFSPTLIYSGMTGAEWIRHGHLGDVLDAADRARRALEN